MAEFKRPLRFCMVTSFYPPYSFGGDAVFVHRLSNELAQRGHSVDVIHNIDAYRLLAGGNPSGTYANHPGVRMHGLETSSGLVSTLAMHQLGSPGVFSSRLKALLQSEFDVIHFHNVSLMGAPESLTYGNAVKLYTMHEYWLVCPTHTLFKFNREVCQKPQCLACSLAYKRPPQLWRYTEKLADAVRNIDVFLALNRFSMEMHQQWGFQSPMQVLSPFVPRSSWTGEAAASSGKQYFLFVGRLERLKGLHTVLPLFEGFGETELWIAGDGSEREALEKQASGNKRVRFLGRLNETQLTQLYRQALAVVVPSLSYEMFGLIVLEAFREGTPAVVARIGGLTEIVESSGGGFAYSSPEELAMRLRELEKNPELRERMGRRGLAAFEERWTPEAHLTQYFSIIQGIAQSRP